MTPPPPPPIPASMTALAVMDIALSTLLGIPANLFFDLKKKAVDDIFLDFMMQ